MQQMFRNKFQMSVACLLLRCLYFCLAIEEAEPDHYSKLQMPSENIYSEAFYGDTALKTKQEGTFLCL